MNEITVINVDAGGWNWCQVSDYAQNSLVILDTCHLPGTISGTHSRSMIDNSLKQPAGDYDGAQYLP